MSLKTGHQTYSADYLVRDVYSSLCIARKTNDAEHLKQALNSDWNSLKQEMTNIATDHWSKRLSLVHALSALACQ